MDFNAIMKIKESWDKFSSNHPKFVAFLNVAKNRNIDNGTIIGISITYPDGKKLESNFIVTQDDKDLIETIKNIPPR